LLKARDAASVSSWGAGEAVGIPTQSPGGDTLHLNDLVEGGDICQPGQGMSLEGQTALVTGAARRIGRAIAVALAEQQVRVVIHYRGSAAPAEELRRSLVTRGSQAFCVRANFDNPDEADSLIERARAEAGPIQILVNSASEFLPEALDAMTHASLVHSMTVNAWAPFALTRAFARQATTGKVVNFIDAQVAGSDLNHASYILSKHLLATLTTMSALQYAPGITVNAVAPGLILPPEGKDEGYLDGLARSLPLKRHGDPADITSAVSFLLESNFVTGQVIYVDGGRHLIGGAR
jgi:NAD(P)-dependent dehydrogenase (short-subunit alcohol dehydrogenase family)